MIKLEDIPNEVAWKLHNKLWGSGQFSVEEGRSAIAAALNAWPGMEVDRRFHGRPDGSSSTQPRIILPLPTENENG